ncbi:hypothetical protein FB107DRAFT_217211 [Schizophyllum commune]
MFVIALAILGASAFVHATQVEPLKTGNDTISHPEGNWTLYASTSSSSILVEGSNAPYPLTLDDFRIPCPSGDHIGALVPVEGASPKQYTLQFLQDDAQLPEGAIYYVRCLGQQSGSLRTMT